MTDIKLLGIDIAKNVFQLSGQSSSGKITYRKRINRSELLNSLSNLKPCTIVMEACSSASYWARELSKFGHKIKLISPQHVKPFVMTNKNDHNDADAIVVAASRPGMLFVAVKSVEQQDIQSLHRIRSRLVSNRTALTNQTRGLLAEYGVAMSKGMATFKQRIVELLADEPEKLSDGFKVCLQEQYDEFIELNKQIKTYTKRIEKIHKENEICQRLSAIEGMGPLSTTALLAAVGDAKVFKNGRQMSAWLGLVPRQHSSGDKQRLLGISKRGDSYIRKLLVHGGRSVVYRAKNKEDRRSNWINELEQRRGCNRTCVALANKNVRIAWALMTSEETYKRAA